MNSSQITVIAREYFSEFVRKNEKRMGDQTGLMLNVCDKRTLNSDIRIVGIFDQTFDGSKKIAREMVNVQIMIATLIAGDHYTTFPMQNSRKRIYGGGVEGEYFYLATSGLTPELNHEFAVEVLKRASQLTDIRLHNIEVEYAKYGKVATEA